MDDLDRLEADEVFCRVLWHVEYRLRGIVTNCLATDGWETEDIVRFLDSRCGRSEQALDEMKNDLAGGRLPSGYFGANAAWWQVMILALNLSRLFRTVALAPGWSLRRRKAIRFHFMCLAGRVVESGRRLKVLFSEAARKPAEVLIQARSRYAIFRPPKPAN